MYFEWELVPVGPG